MKQIGILIDHCDLRADVIQAEIFQIMATDFDGAGIRIIKAQQQAHDG